MKKVLFILIAFYRRAISPYLRSSCKFFPTCSEYSRQAIEKYGVLKGVLKSICRIIRCNPLFKGGIDFP